MRVTSHSFTESFLSQLNLLTARQARLQQQAASGQRIRLPEDDPAAIQRSLALGLDNAAIEQFARNIATPGTRLSETRRSSMDGSAQ